MKDRLSADWNTKDARGALRPASGKITIGAFQYGSDVQVGLPSNKMEYTVYPTMFNDKLTIEAAEGLSISILNVTGTTMISTVSKGSTTIPTASFPSGIYFVTVGNQVTKVMKF